jgi:hypothetical protein
VRQASAASVFGEAVKLLMENVPVCDSVLKLLTAP